MKIRAFLFVVFSLFASYIHAGTTTGKVVAVYVHVFNDVIAFNIQTAQPNYANCASTHRYAVSTSTSQGRNVLSVVLAAKAAGQTITVVGMNTCTAESGSEDIQWLYVE